ncbi:chromate resistance protein ChrB domain-containing protein, partial [Klebsiella pneumoniae]|uniref:chromate resistance protein ChrB domain-containing protein n=1 Tax=Klebsiella pneumoniae TaxID=573 RepID=UPI0013D47F1A
IHVDRIACSWLIRRFIDPQAVIRFVPGKGYVPKPGELRFDMFEGEITHEGDRCSFEVLLGRAGIADPAVQAIAEIVHDIDLKDGKFGRDET